MVHNAQVQSGEKPSIRIWLFDENSQIDHVTISGLNILGGEIFSFDQLDYKASPANGENISFLPYENE